MVVPPIAKATLRAVIIHAASNVLAQGIQAYQNEGPYELDIRFLVEATICAYILSPLGYLWLDFLNAWLPDRAPPSLASDEEATDTKSDSNDEKPTLNDEKAPLNMVNTIAKVVISQTIGGAWNTVLYIAIMGMLRGLDFEYILWQIQEDFRPMMLGGFQLWFFVPASERMIASSPLGIVWGFYLSYAYM